MHQVSNINILPGGWKILPIHLPTYVNLFTEKRETMRMIKRGCREIVHMDQ